MPTRLRPLVALLVAGCALPPGAAAVTLTRAVTVRSQPEVVGPRSASGLGLVELRQLPARTTVRLGSWNGRGAARFAPRRAVRFGSRGRYSDDAAVTPSGAVAAVRGPGRSLRAIVATAGGLTSQRISHPGHLPSEPQVLVGGRAVGIAFYERATGGGVQLMWAYKPAGARRFLPSRSLDAPHEEGGARYELALGPDGSGALVAGPELENLPGLPVRVRRLGADGAIGPELQLDGIYDDGFFTLGVGPDGTIAIALSETGVPSGDPHGERVTSLITTSLLPGALALSPPRVHATDSADALEDETLHVSVRADRQVLVTASLVLDPDARGVLVLGGPPDDLHELARYDANDPSILSAFTRDGGMMVAWRDQVDGFGPSPILATYRSPTGSWDAPRIVAQSKIGGSYPDLTPVDLVPFGRHGAALVVDDGNVDIGITRIGVLEPYALAPRGLPPRS